MKMNPDKELQIIKKFDLDPDYAVLIKCVSCFYQGKGVPVPGKLYLFHDCLCFNSKFNTKTLFLHQTKIIIYIKDIILCEFLPNTFGIGIALTIV